MGTASPTTREVSHSSSSITMATIRQNYSEECEALVNKYVNTKLYHSYVYLYMSSYFYRDDQALTGFADFFLKASEEEHRHAAALMEYQTKRGGGGAAKHHQAHRYGVGDCSRGDGCCLRYGEGGNPMPGDPGDPGHHQGRLPPRHLHPGELLEETGSGHQEDR